MRPDQPLTPEGAYLSYLLSVSEAGALPAWRPERWPDGEVAWVFERQERAAFYALGRMRESVVHRIKRLPVPERSAEREFLVRVLAQCQDDDGGRIMAPRWPAANLGAIVGMIRERLVLRMVA